MSSRRNQLAGARLHGNRSIRLLRPPTKRPRKWNIWALPCNLWKRKYFFTYFTPIGTTGGGAKALPREVLFQSSTYIGTYISMIFLHNHFFRPPGITWDVWIILWKNLFNYSMGIERWRYFPLSTAASIIVVTILKVEVKCRWDSKSGRSSSFKVSAIRDIASLPCKRFTTESGSKKCELP
jgi:hypothetical protein